MRMEKNSVYVTCVFGEHGTTWFPLRSVAVPAFFHMLSHALSIEVNLEKHRQIQSEILLMMFYVLVGLASYLH